MKSRIILFLVFSSFVIGKAQTPCDTFKRVDIRAEYRVVGFEPLHIEIGEPQPALDPPDPNEWRRIYFIHGLGGTAEAWEKAAEACEIGAHGFSARKCLTSRPEYASSSTGSLNSAASDIRGQMNVIGTTDSLSGFTLPRRSIVIAHSQGGLVARQLMHLDLVTSPLPINHGINYGGVVTIASPLQGAAILKNRNDIFTLANDGCNRLPLGPVTRAIYQVPLNFSFNLLGFSYSSNDLKKSISVLFRGMLPKICEIATDNIMPMFFKEYYKDITADYNPGTTYGVNYINNLNADVNFTKYQDFPKIAFYAVEPQENIFWRTLNWMLNNPNGSNGQSGPNIGHFQANNDWHLYDNTINDLFAHYQAQSTSFYNIYYSCMVAAGKEKKKKIQDALYAQANLMFVFYDAYEQGVEWFNNVNKSWQSIIGAKSYNSSAVKENDGVVLAESAANLPGSQRQAIRMEGSSHMQVRNDENLKTHLNHLFNGDYGPFFKVNTK